MNNLLSYCGLVDRRISASEKDLPVQGLKKLCSLEHIHMMMGKTRDLQRGHDMWWDFAFPENTVHDPMK